ncbi:YdcF family protein [Romboutsia weinsteinii]|uniref:YdcF family protein n=1 Tax=Romboutsia weinsteinii TaxID=2020949 RepID=A0A371IZ43_9FIRM|nr:YdcF family protein [Romboutsia weinsteinii]RDY25753.1 YdcF family protein [Romboutsia weinsteinii]
MKNSYLIIGLILFSTYIISINGVNFSAIFIVTTIWMICSVYFIRKFMIKRNERWIQLLARVYQILVIIFVVSFIIIEGLLIFNIHQFKEIKDIEKLDYVVVLGAGIDGEKVGKTLQSRLDQAIKYYENNKAVNIIVSGGQSEGEIISEAEAMHRYLVENGVNPGNIIKEDKATSTLENIRFAKDILISRNDLDKKILIVTNEFHLYRAMIIADILGLKNEGLASSTPIKIRVNYMIREYPTLIIDTIRTFKYK